MIIGLILYMTIICAVAVMIKLIKPALSSTLVKAIRFQLECVFGLFGKWIQYLIAVVPVLVIMAMSGKSNHIIVSMEILFLFSLIILVLFQRIKQAIILSAKVLHE